MVNVRFFIYSFLLLPTLLMARDPFKLPQKNVALKPQILVQAKIVRINSDCINDLGFQWQQSRSQVRDRRGLSLSLPQADGAFNFHLLTLSSENFINLQLRAIESSGSGEVIAKPRLLISSGKTASIESGDQIPYIERVGQDSTATAFKKAVLGLKVTARVLRDHRIELDLTVTQDKPTGQQLDRVPSIHTATLKTSVVVGDGQTVVLGGIYDDSKQVIISGVPWLKDLPIVGTIFRRQVVSSVRDEILIFVHSSVVPCLPDVGSSA